MSDIRSEPVRGNVLVIEDDADCGMVILNILCNEGYGVRLVKSRDAAITAIRRYLYEYIILDVRMPGMKVPDFLAVVAITARNANVILTTAENDAANEAKRFGIANWIGKPFTPEQLVGLVNRLKAIPRVDSSFKI